MITIKERGTYGESLVANKLKQQGLKILARNYRKQYGEIDLIAGNNEMLVFVEVKLRSSHFVALEELIVASKQRKIITTAKTYLAENDHRDKCCRFDVALIDGVDKPNITYIPNAFQADD